MKTELNMLITAEQAEDVEGTNEADAFTDSICKGSKENAYHISTHAKCI